jgi:hypothetical protein
MKSWRQHLRSALGLAALALLLAGASTATAGALPPGIDDLDGAVCTLAVSSTEYDLSAGVGQSHKEELAWTFTKTGPDTLRIQEQKGPEGATMYARYSHGVLIIGWVNDPDLATDAASAYLVVTGTRGKLKLKGEFISFQNDPSEAQVGKLSGKQTGTR